MSAEILRPASKVKRVLAYGMEAVIMSLLTLLPLVGPLIAVAYMLGRDGCGNGASLGKMLLGMRVVDFKTGEPAGLTASFLRNLPFAIGFFLPVIPILGHVLGAGFAALVFKIEVIVMCISAMHRRFGDKLAGTCVVEHHLIQRASMHAHLSDDETR